MVNICLGFNNADGVRAAFENVFYAIDNYCEFLEKNICGDEETDDAAEEEPITEQQLEQRRRHGIRTGRRDSYNKDDSKLEGTLSRIGEGEGEGGSGEECGQEGKASHADDKQGAEATGQGDVHTE